MFVSCVHCWIFLLLFASKIQEQVSTTVENYL